jgi:hypothetical protein
MAPGGAAVIITGRKIADCVRSLQVGHGMQVGRLWVHWIGDHQDCLPS